jgi:hypothetical protein
MKKTSEEDLLLSMTKRLNLVEKEFKEEKQKNKVLQEEITKLKSEVITRIKPESFSSCTECIKLKNHINKLNDYISSLKEFMKDNGFILMNSCPEEIFEEDSDLNLNIIPKEIDINILTKRIEEMNFLTVKDGDASRFEKDQDGIYKLKVQKELNIFFYKNGLVVETYNFYLYNTIEAKRILHDILDGYMPYILQKAFPHGVLLKIVNNLHLDYTDPPQDTKNVKEIARPKVKEAMSGDDFLKLFPEKVIRNGKIYNIREDMESFLVTKKNNDYNLDTNEYYLPENMDKDIIDRDKLDNIFDKFCKLKIKIPCIDKIFLINANKELTIDLVYNFLNKRLGEFKSRQKELILISTFPFRIYEKTLKDNLEQLGLFPSHFLIFEEKKNYAK